MKFISILRIYILLLISGCENKTVPLHEQFVFESTSTLNTSAFSVQQAILNADSIGRLHLHLELFNRSEKVISFSSSDWQLETSDGLHSSPVLVNDSVINVKPKSTYTNNFIFEPINSLKLHHYTGLKGDLDRQYKLIIKDVLGVINFELLEPQHYQFLEKWGKEKELIVFQFETQPDFDSVQTQYLAKNIKLGNDGERIVHSSHGSELEILVDGLNSRFSSFTFRDTLTMKVRLTNHSPFVTGITASSMQIQIDSLVMKPILKNGTDHFEIPRSQRASIELKYVLPVLKVSGFTLDVSSLSFLTPKPVPVLYRKKMVFKKVSL